MFSKVYGLYYLFEICLLNKCWYEYLVIGIGYVFINKISYWSFFMMLGIDFLVVEM